MPEGTVYTPPEVCNYDEDLSKSWFVYFDFTDHDLGITARKQFRGGINYYKTVPERTKAGDQLKKFWEERLKHGWTPFSISASKLTKMPFGEALTYGVSKCAVSKRTKDGYKRCVEYIKQAAKKLGLLNARIGAIERRHMRLLLQECKDDKKWSNHAYNKYHDYISSVLSQLEQDDIVKNNPAHKIKSLPVAESNKFKPLTKVEKTKIRENILPAHPRFYTILMLIYHTGIRPKEALALKDTDIYFDERYICIEPDLEEENSKTKSVRIVALNDHILNLLKEHLNGHVNCGMYVFGNPNGKGERKFFKEDKIFFSPSFRMIPRNTLTLLYKIMVWEGLGIHKYMYAMKRTGGDDKILADIPLDALKEMYGHKSKFMTELYAKQVKEVYRKQIIANSPDF